MRTLLALLIFLFTIVFSNEIRGQLVCPTFSSGNLGNGGAAGSLPFSAPSGFGKSGNFTFSNASDLNITAAFINGSQVQNSTGIISGSNFFFSHLTSNNITYYSDLNGNNANLRAGTYAFTFTSGANTATCSYTINVSGSNFSIVSLNPGSIGNDQTICANTSPNSLTMITPASGGSGSYTYQWQESTNGSTFTDVSSGGTSTSYSPGSLSATRYYQLKVTDGNSNVSTSNKVTITINGAAGVWNGSSNTNFNNSANWCGSSLPTSSSNVYIGSSSNNPVVTANITVNSLTIQSGATLSFSGGVLTATNGIIVEPGGMLNGSSENISGTVTIQQTMRGQRGWRVLSNPFTTTTNFSTIGTNNNISIETTGANNAATISDVRAYNNSTGTWSDGGTSTVANTPYALFIRGTSSEVSKLNYSGGPSTITYAVSGTLNSNSVAVTPGSTSQYMIVGNPYAAPVNTRALTGGTSEAYYTYQVPRGSSQSTQRSRAGSWVVQGSNSNTTNTIPPLGVISYMPSNTNSFNITTSDINTSGTLITGVFGDVSSYQQMELLLQNSLGDYGDKLFVRFDSKANPKANDINDIKKFYNDIINIYTLSEEKSHLAIDARSSLNSIPVFINAPVGEYKFKVGSNYLPMNTKLFIKDNFANTVREISESLEYKFNITTDLASKGANRFQLVFGVNNATAIDEPENKEFKVDVLGNAISGSKVALMISGLKNNTGSIRVMNLNGQSISTSNITNGLQYIDLNSKSSGLHFLYISDGKSTTVKKIVKM